MNAAQPATWPTVSFKQLFAGPANAPRPRLDMLGIFHPANKFIARQRCNVLPQRKYLRIGENRFSQIFGHLMHRPTRDIFRWHMFILHLFSANEK